VYLFKVEC